MACTALLAGAAAASAHPSLLGSSPGPGLVARTGPTQVQLAFTEDVELSGSSLTVRGPKGRVAASSPTSPEGGPGMRIRLRRKLDPGVYTVTWVVLGDDGHTVSGDYRFAVALPDGELPSGAAGLASSEAGGRGDESADSEGVLTVAMRWLSILTASLLLGGALLVRRMRARPEDGGSDVDDVDGVRRRFARLRTWALVLGGLAAAELIAVTVTAGVGSDVRFGLLTATTTGAMAVARLVVVLLAGVALVGLRGRGAPVVVAAAGAAVLLTHALDGHTSVVEDGRLTAGLVQSAHVLGAGLWAGGLLALAGIVALTPGGAGRLAIARRAARALAPIAGVAALVVLASGIVSALREVDEWYFLRWSDYGRVVIAKLGAWLLLGAAGGTAFLLLRRGRPLFGNVLRVEAVGVAGVLVLAAVLAGLVQGRGQPLPAQRGNLLAGAGFGNAPVGKALLRVTLSPSRPGANALTAVVGPPELGDPVPRTDRVQVRLTCSCSPGPVDAVLERTGDDTWRSTVRLPAEGLWEARVRVDGANALAGLPFAVNEFRTRGSDPLVAISTADLSGPDAQRCRSHHLGVVLALAGANARGGEDGGRKLVQRVYDDRGDPERARRITARSDGVALVAPCGAGAPGALRGAAGRMPAIVTDPGVPVVRREGIYRTAPTGLTEGTALGQIVRTLGVQSFPGAPKRVAVLAPRGTQGDGVVRGLRAALKGTRLEVDPVRFEGRATRKQVRDAIEGERYIATYLDGDARRLAGLLADIGRSERRIVPAAIFASARLFNERFQTDAGLLGRIGSLRAIGEVNPSTRDAFGYSNLVRGLYVGERPTIDGLRGFMAGQAFVEGLAGGGDDVEDRLRDAGRYSDTLASGWSPESPGAGGGLVGFFLPNFLPSGLIPESSGGQQFTGSYFEDGSWQVLTPKLYGPRATITANPAAPDPGANRRPAPSPRPPGP